MSYCKKEKTDGPIDKIDNVVEASLDGLDYATDKLFVSLSRVWNMMVTILRIPLNILHFFIDLIFIKILRL